MIATDAAAYTAIGHRGMAICNPLASGQLDEVIAVIAGDGAAGAGTAVDVGCGKAELLIRLAGHGCRGLGVDRNPALVAEARAAIAARCPGQVEIVEADAAAYPLPPGGFAIAAALGASHALGGTAATLAALAAATRPGGHVVVGDGFWRRPPSLDELAALDAAPDEMTSLAALVAQVDAAGLEPIHVAVARDDDFDRYEWAHHRNLEAHARAHPDDPQAQRLWARRKAWRDAYLRAARHVVGFAVIAARKPGPPPRRADPARRRGSAT
jgi:SAM-dependent methyltransferase